MPGSIYGIEKILFCALLIAANSAFAAAERGDSETSVFSNDAVKINPGSGSFSVPGGAGREDRPIEIHYHRPETLAPDPPVMIVIPGAGRNGDDYRDAWVTASEQYGILILSPGYSEIHYPELWSYHLGNMADSVTVNVRVKLDATPAAWKFGEAVDENSADLERLSQRSPLMQRLALLALAGMVADTHVEGTRATVNTDRNAWIYSDFDRIFEIARNALDLEAETYDLFGHSAGGQILHRFALFHPDNRANRILAANAGWYTLPEFETAFPYGLKDTGMSADEIRNAFQSDLIVFLGEKDDEHETRGSLRETSEANRQGPGRLQRGKFFFANAQAVARQLDAELRWKLEVVPGVGHDYRGMAVAAAEYLYGGNR